MKRYIKSSQSIFAGYSCNGWFNILKNQKIPDDIEQFDDDYTAQYNYKKQWSWGYGETHPDYVEDGFETIVKYTGGHDRNINNYLRGLPYDNEPGWFDKLTTEEKADRMHREISNYTIPYDIVTVRWATIDNLIAYLGKDAPKNIQNGDVEQYIGDIVKEPGFYSSSMSMHPRQSIWDHDREVQFINLLPKGTNAVYIFDYISRKGREDEILLLNGSSFIIRDIQYSATGFDASSGLQSNSKYRVFMEKI
jgi:hypothetical protein